MGFQVEGMGIEFGALMSSLSGWASFCFGVRESRLAEDHLFCFCYAVEVDAFKAKHMSDLHGLHRPALQGVGVAGVLNTYHSDAI